MGLGQRVVRAATACHIRIRRIVCNPQDELAQAAVKMRALPVRTGRYPLLTPQGQVRWHRVVRMNDDLYAVHGWLGAVATPVDLIDGVWLVPAHGDATA